MFVKLNECITCISQLIKYKEVSLYRRYKCTNTTIQVCVLSKTSKVCINPKSLLTVDNSPQTQGG